VILDAWLPSEASAPFGGWPWNGVRGLLPTAFRCWHAPNSIPCSCLGADWRRQYPNAHLLRCFHAIGGEGYRFMRSDCRPGSPQIEHGLAQHMAHACFSVGRATAPSRVTNKRAKPAARLIGRRNSPAKHPQVVDPVPRQRKRPHLILPISLSRKS